MSDRSHSFIKRMTAVVCSLLLTAVSTPFTAECLMSANAADVYAELYVSPDGDGSPSNSRKST